MSQEQRPRLAALRAATAIQHKELDGIIQLMDEHVQKSYYSRILQLFYGFIQSFQSSLFAHPEWTHVLPLAQLRKKSERLKADLKELEVNVETLATNLTPPPTSKFSEALGVMYVMEGSTLGGQMMTQHLTKKFPELSHNYMRGYGVETGKMWQQFLTALENVEMTAEQELEMQKAAQATFTSLKNWFLSGLRQ